MKKRTVTLSLVLIGPSLLAGCSSSQNRDGYCDPNNPNDPDCRTGSGYRGSGGHFYGGSRYRSAPSTDSGGFGSTGRGFFSFGS